MLRKIGIGTLALGLCMFGAALLTPSRYASSDARGITAILGELLACAGIILLLWLRPKKPEFGVPSSSSVPEELILNDVRFPYASRDRYSRFPLGRKFVGMPHVALLICGVFMVLLTIFWVFSPPPPRGHWVSVKPMPPHVLAGAPDDPIVVSVRRTSSPAFDRPALFVNSQPVAWENLRATLHAQLSQHANVVYIDGDDVVPYQDFIRVVDIARAAWPDVPVVLKTPGLESTSKQ